MHDSSPFPRAALRRGGGTRTDGIAPDEHRPLAPPWRDRAARKEAHRLAVRHRLSDRQTTVQSARDKEDQLRQKPTASLLAPTVLFLRNALERAAAGLLVHKAARACIALHKIAVGGLKLRPVIHRTAPKPITRILRHGRLLFAAAEMGSFGQVTRCTVTLHMHSLSIC